jgi:hypothetical protein
MNIKFTGEFVSLRNQAVQEETCSVESATSPHHNLLMGASLVEERD